MQKRRPERKDFGEWLRDRLDESGLNPTQLARRSGVPRPTIVGWLKKGRYPHPENEAKIKAIFEKSVPIRSEYPHREYSDEERWTIRVVNRLLESAGLADRLSIVERDRGPFGESEMRNESEQEILDLYRSLDDIHRQIVLDVTRMCRSAKLIRERWIKNVI